MKAISDVIAMLLMLVITIGLVGLAYSYISGVFTARTAVVLSIDSASSVCDVSNNKIIVYVRNDGTQPSATVSISATAPNGAPAGSCTIDQVPSGSTAYCDFTRNVRMSGYYRIVASTPGSTAVGQIYCIS